MHKLLFIALMLVSLKGICAPLANTNNSAFYYQIGGARSISLPANVNAKSTILNASYEYGLGYSCGNFDPIAGVADAINGLKGTKDKLITGAVGAVTSAIGSLPALIMQRVDPETDLKTTKIELKAVQKKAIEGDRLIARFEGQLAVYEKIEAQKKMNE